MFESPQVIAVLFDILKIQIINIFHNLSIEDCLLISNTTTYRVEAEEDKQRDGRHASTLPFFKRNGAVVVVIDLRHHFLEDLYVRPCGYYTFIH